MTRPTAKSLHDLQNEAAWGAHTYSDAFNADPRPHRDAAHAVLHIAKATGKLCGAIDNLDHAEELDPRTVPKALADVVICALRVANTWPVGKIDVADAIDARLAEKGIGPSATETTDISKDAQIEHLKDVLHRDRSGLASALAHVRQIVGGYEWATTSRGPYKYDDDEYKREFGRCIDQISTVCNDAIEASGKLAHAECCGGRRDPDPQIVWIDEFEQSTAHVAGFFLVATCQTARLAGKPTGWQAIAWRGSEQLGTMGADSREQAKDRCLLLMRAVQGSGRDGR